MKKLIIYFENGKWKGFEPPEKPEFKGDYFLHYGPQKKYEADYAEARANAIEILNPELMDDFEFELSMPMHTAAEEGKDYDWPEEDYSIKHKFYFKEKKKSNWEECSGDEYMDYECQKELEVKHEKYIILSLPASAMGYSEGSEVPKEETQDELWWSALIMSISYNWTDSKQEKAFLLEKLKAKYVLTRR